MVSRGRSRPRRGKRRSSRAANRKTPRISITVTAPDRSGPTTTAARILETLQERPHAHIVCRACGRIATVSFPAEEEVLLERLALRRPAGWEVDGITYTLTGSCQRCREGPAT